MGDRITVQWEYRLTSHRFSIPVPNPLYLMLAASFVIDVWGGILSGRPKRGNPR